MTSTTSASANASVPELDSGSGGAPEGTSPAAFYGPQLGFATLRYLGFWLMVFGAQALAMSYDRDWRLIRSPTALSIVSQITAPTATALLVLILASAFVVAQMATALHGSRTALLLLGDIRFLWLVLRGLLITLASLFVVVLVPSRGLSVAADASAATVLLAVANLAFTACVTLATLVNLYTAPRIFATDLVARIAAEILKGADGVAGFKVPALGEMLRQAVKRGDGVAVNASLEAIEQMVVFWTSYVSEHPSARSLRMPSGSVRPGWLIRDVAQALTRAVDEALRSGTPSDEVDLMIDELEHVAVAAAIAGLDDECRLTVEYLTAVGTTAHQVVGPQTVNLLPRPAACLATVEMMCEDVENVDLAAFALAHWALVITWMHTQYGHVHPMLFTTPRHFGPHPPWHAAKVVIDSRDFREHWVNQLHDPQQLAVTLHAARDVYEGRSLRDAPTRRRSFRLRSLLRSAASRPNVLGVPPPPRPAPKQA